MDNGGIQAYMGYRLMYDALVGGVLTMHIDDMVRVNGYSNAFWGWGGEDDEMGASIHAL